MKKFNNKKGITLIALIITIIVLLILAGITVAQLSGNNLFENAKLAKEKYQQARDQENEIIGDYEDAITGDRGSKFNYSTEEQVVGTWITGKPLYQKTIDIGYLPNATYKLTNASISNLDKVISLNGICYANDSYGSVMSLPMVLENAYATYNVALQYWKNTDQIRVVTGMDRSGFYAYVTIQYTKTTD